MTSDSTKPKIDKIYLTVLAIAVFLLWTLHEFAHWLVGEYSGYEMGMTLNKAYPLSGEFSKDLHYHIISAAGPIFNLVTALLVFILMMQRKRILLYPFLFTSFYMRFFATIISFHHPNDEARISAAIGIGTFTLPFIISSILFLLIFKISKKYCLNLKFNLANLALTILFSSVIILTDLYFKIQLL